MSWLVGQMMTVTPLPKFTSELLLLETRVSVPRLASVATPAEIVILPCAVSQFVPSVARYDTHVLFGMTVAAWKPTSALPNVMLPVPGEPDTLTLTMSKKVGSCTVMAGYASVNSVPFGDAEFGSTVKDSPLASVADEP